jgi:hypothetical protein
MIAYQVYFACLEDFWRYVVCVSIVETWLLSYGTRYPFATCPINSSRLKNDFGLPSRSLKVKTRHAHYPSVDALCIAATTAWSVFLELVRVL